MYIFIWIPKTPLSFNPNCYTNIFQLNIHILCEYKWVYDYLVIISEYLDPHSRHVIGVKADIMLYTRHIISFTIECLNFYIQSEYLLANQISKDQIKYVLGHENWPTQFKKFIKAFFNANFLYIFCYILAYLSYLNNMWVPIEKKPATSEHEISLKCCTALK
jgi:hypothetical protein